MAPPSPAARSRVPAGFLVIAVGEEFTAAGAILVAQHTGAGGDRAAEKIAGRTLGFVSIVAVVVGAVAFIATGPLLALPPAGPATAERVVPSAAVYMRVFFLGAPALFGLFVFTALMRGVGDTHTPLVVMVLSVVDVALDPFMIFDWWVFPVLGVEGAAIATVTSRTIATVAGLYVLFGTGLGPTIELRDLIPEPGPVREIVELGVPTALEQSGTALAVVVATFPPAVVAAHGLGDHLTPVVTLPAMGLSQAMDTAVGENLGANEPERATWVVKLGGVLVVAALTAVAVVVAAVPEPIVAVFRPASAPAAVDTITHASRSLRISSVAFVFFGVF